MEKIRLAVTEIWVPQVWQPPARPPARPDHDYNTPPARRAEGLKMADHNGDKLLTMHTYFLHEGLYLDAPLVGLQVDTAKH